MTATQRQDQCPSAQLGERTSHLQAEQNATLSTPRMNAGVLAKTLFQSMDLIYGSGGSLAKFRVLEVIARVPYMAWEHVGYVAITHTHSTPTFARDIHSSVQQNRAQQDNELFHLLILEELLQRRGERQGFFRFRVIPQIFAWSYYQISWLLFALHPRMSYRLNAQFEDHAEHEYMQYVADHPELEDEPWESAFHNEYGSFDSVADMLRQIGVDERHHKEESLESMATARFGSRR